MKYLVRLLGRLILKVVIEEYLENIHFLMTVLSLKKTVLTRFL